LTELEEVGRYLDHDTGSDYTVAVEDSIQKMLLVEMSGTGNIGFQMYIAATVGVCVVGIVDNQLAVAGSVRERI